jgi:hypothetical protein
MRRITFIRHIRRPLWEKIILAFLMGAGLIAIAAGIVKTILMDEVTANADFFYRLSNLSVWL